MMTMMTYWKRSRAVLVPALAFVVAAAASPARAQNTPAADTAAAQAEQVYELNVVEEQPNLLNRRDVSRLVAALYPPEQQSRGETGTATVRFVIQRDGTVDSARVTIVHASIPEFAEPAAATARAMRFRPARLNGQSVAVWVTLPITFTLESRVAPATRAPGDARPQNPPTAPATVPAEGTYSLSEVEEQPMLANRADMARLIQRSYPPEMRSRGETGTVTLRFRIQTDGRVDSASVMIENASSPEFTEPAAKVARAMRFRPAKIENRAVPVWVTLPITFMPVPRTAPATRAPGDARPPRPRR